jgi:hypothetical protein
MGKTLGSSKGFDGSSGAIDGGFAGTIDQLAATKDGSVVAASGNHAWVSTAKGGKVTVNEYVETTSAKGAQVWVLVGVGSAC